MSDDTPKRKVPAAPRALQTEGKRLWRQIWATYDLNPGESAVLETACRARDTAEALRGELQGEHFIDYMGQPVPISTYMVAGSMGQPVINPLVAEIRHHEKLAADLVASLNLPDDPGQEGSSGERNQQRDAVNARWAQRG